MMKEFKCFLLCLFFVGLLLVTTNCNQATRTSLTPPDTIQKSPSIEFQTTLSPSPLVTSTLYPSRINLPTAANKAIPTQTPTRLLTVTQTLTPIVTETPSIISLVQSSYMPNYIRSMLIDQQGNLWTGGKEGVVRWDIKNDSHEIYSTRNGLVSYDILAIAQTPDKSMWFGTSGAGVLRFDGKNWQVYTTQDGLPGDYIDSLIVMTDGSLLALSRPSKYKDKPSKIVSYNGISWSPSSGGGFDAIVAAPDGTIWGEAYFRGLAHFDGVAKWEHLSNTNITALTVAKDGTAWVASTENVYQVIGSTLYKLNPPWLGKTEASVSSIVVDPVGIVWFGFSYAPPYLIDRCGERNQYEDEFGIYSFDGKNWVHYTTKDGLVDNKICAIVIGLDGSAWFGTYDKGVSRFDGHNWTTYTVP